MDRSYVSALKLVGLGYHLVGLAWDLTDAYNRKHGAAHRPEVTEHGGPDLLPQSFVVKPDALSRHSLPIFRIHGLDPMFVVLLVENSMPKRKLLC